MIFRCACPRLHGGCGHKGDCTHDGERAHCPKCGNSWRHFLPRDYAPGPPRPRYSIGPGTALKKTLRWFGIVETASCNCTSKVGLLNKWGPDESESHLETIVGWLRDAAEQREMPFWPWAARMLVRRAIRKSRASLILS